MKDKSLFPEFLNRLFFKNAALFLCVIFLTLFIGHTGRSYSEPAQNKNEITAQEDKIPNHLLPPSPDSASDLENTSVDIPRLKKAKTLKEIYQLAMKMHVGSASDQEALTRVVYEHMMRCCKDYDRAIKEVEHAGFKKIKDVTHNYSNHKKKAYPEYDQVMISVLLTPVWRFPEILHIKAFLYALWPYTNQRAITLYFKDHQLINVHSTMHTE